MWESKARKGPISTTYEKYRHTKTAARSNNQEHLLPECPLAQIADFVSTPVRRGWQVGDLPITTEPTWTEVESVVFNNRGNLRRVKGDLEDALQDLSLER